MIAFHSFWSVPHKRRNHGRIIFADFELLVMALSALKWRQLNGSIVMITDSAGAEYFKSQNLSFIWDKPISTDLDNMPSHIEPSLFWASGKLFALDRMECPCVMLDTDIIVWESVLDRLKDEIVVTHEEELIERTYPDVSNFGLNPNYKIPEEWDFSLFATNTAFLYIPDINFRSTYINAAFEFMFATTDKGNIDPVPRMCFAEQRILPMLAKQHGKIIDPMLDQYALDDQTTMTHIWGDKNKLINSQERREQMCISCMRRLLMDFPEYRELFSKVERFKQYYDFVVNSQ